MWKHGDGRAVPLDVLAQEHPDHRAPEITWHFLDYRQNWLGIILVRPTGRHHGRAWNPVGRIVKSERSFPLIELVTMIILIGVLAAIAIPMYVDLRENATVSPPIFWGDGIDSAPDGGIGL